MKVMVRLMQEVAETFNKEVGKLADKKEDIELKDLFGKYTLDSMASSVFGVEIRSFENPSSPFITYAKQLSTFDFFDTLKMFPLLIPGMSKVFGKLGFSVMKPKATKFFYDSLINIIKSRRESKIRRNDMIDLLLDTMKGEGEGKEEDEFKDDQFEMDSKLEKASSKVWV